MTDRYSALFVVLDRDIRADDAEPLIAAIRQLRGVADVTPRRAETADIIARMRIRNDIGNKLIELLRFETDVDQ